MEGLISWTAGSYARTTALDKLVHAFLRRDTSQKRQVVSLGAGTDTRCFRLFGGDGEGVAHAHAQNVEYHEIDFPQVCVSKMRTVQASAVLSRVLPDAAPCRDENDGSWTARTGVPGSRYFCHGIDLRRFTHVPGLDPDAATLVISECCLCYLDVSVADGVLAYFSRTVAAAARLGVVLYEPVRAADAFGQVMMRNLAARRVVMPTVLAYGEPEDQVSRLEGLGFGGGEGMAGARCVPMDEVWDRWIGQEETKRVSKLEGLDEVEEWQLLSRHYAIAWAWRGAEFGWEKGESDDREATPTG